MAEESYKASTAYRKVYGSTMSPTVSNAAAYKLLQKEEIKRYLSFIQAEISDKYEVTKESQIKDLQQIKMDYQVMKSLGRKDKLTKDEQAKYDRMVKDFKGTDYNKSMDMLNRMVGAYEAEQIEIKQEWRISFTEEEEDNDSTDK